MEILFIWVKKYKAIEEEGFNFGGDYRFKYISEFGELQILSNAGYLEDFFCLLPEEEAAKITNVTAIVGKNGSGKTTLLDFIKDNLIDGMGGIKEQAIIVVKDNGKYVIYHHKDINLRPIAHDDFKVKSYSNKTTQLQAGMVITYPEIEESKNVNFIFFSNIFDTRHEEGHGNLINISTNYLVKQDRINAYENYSGAYAGTSDVETHRLQDVYRQVHFIQSFPRGLSVRLRLPETIAIYPIAHNVKANLEKMYGDYAEFVENYENYSAIFLNEDNSQTGKGSSILDIVRIRFYRAILYNFLRECYLYNQKISKDFLRLIERDMLNPFEEVEFLFDKLSQGKEVVGGENVKLDIQPINEFKIKVKAIQSLIKLIDEIIPNYTTKTKYLTEGTVIRLSIDGNKSGFKKFFNIYKKCFINSQFLNFDWDGLSSGEKAMLNIYSRFYSVVDDGTMIKRQIKNKLIILMDEGEVYFHPQWQKEFLFDLLKFLSILFKNTQIQLISTSNSPFIASDLPNGHIIFLNREGNKTTVIDSLEDNYQTFAANIHTLYAKSFFVKNGLISDFAKHKINEIINLLVDGSINDISNNRDKIEKIIRFIGEPLLKNKLMTMLKDRLALDLITMGTKVNNLQEQINQLCRGKSK